MSVVAKRLDGLGYHLVRRYASAGQVTLDGDPAPPTGPTERGTVAPSSLFGPLLWQGRPPQLLLSSLDSTI